MNKTPRKGDAALISYICCDAEDGSELERTESPVQVIIGNQDILPALEKLLMGMLPGETKTVVLKPSKAFGPVYDDLFLEVPLNMLELDGNVEIGDTLEVNEEGEESCPGTVVEIYDNAVLVDCNHPMAGRSLSFEMTFIDFA